MPAITGRPKYLDVADDLRKKIATGSYSVGGELPSTSRLMELYDVSVTVVRAAVRELRTEGLVVGQPGKAVYVQAEPSPATPSDEFVELTGQLRAMHEILDNFEARLVRVEEAAGLGRPKRSSQARSAGRRERRA